ncbi:urease accessory protein UreD [Ectobacillus funiculus]|uniref:Urease accessory protein UreD n=1 Tax=Ectobacillus funiculus TaxID=137993 RepID=A0ABV5WBN6_9BACI
MEHTGSLCLEAVQKDGQTIISDCWFEGAFKVTRPVYLESSHPTIYCIHVGGGYVNGDSYETSISLKEDARLTVTTQASTKVYRTPDKPVRQYTSILLKQGSILEFLPDPLIAYEKSRFVQETTVHMERGATFLYSDIITPGWSKTGEHFQYDWVRSKLKIYEDEKLQVYDHLFLQPKGHDMSSFMQMEGYTHFGAWLLVSPFVTEQWIKELSNILETCSSEARIGWSALKTNGIVVRVLAYHTQAIERIFQACTDLVRRQWQQVPLDLRKY